MGHRFAEIAFTDSVREVQQQLGSRAGYAALDGGEDFNNLLSEREASFISARDSFYMASVSETGWPYLQHRGGQTGFVRIIDAQTIGFADFSGNRQYISVGNLRKDDRVSLFFMDYPNRTRLKILGRVRLVGDDEPELLAQLELDDYRAVVERGFVIRIEAFDWNCPQHITPRYTDADIESTVAPLLQELNELKAGGARSVPPAELGDGPLPLVITGVRELAPRFAPTNCAIRTAVNYPRFRQARIYKFRCSSPDGKPGYATIQFARIRIVAISTKLQYCAMTTAWWIDSRA